MRILSLFPTFQKLSVVLLLSTSPLYTLQVGVKAEWDKPKIIIMHTPGSEVFSGALHANAALFENPFDTEAAKTEHKNYIEALSSHNIEIVQLKDALLKGTVNTDGTKCEGKELDALIKFAGNFLTYKFPSDWAKNSKAAQTEYKNTTLRSLHPKDLIRIILERPTVELDYSTEGNTQLIATRYTCEPLMNIHFLRDQQITTDKGVVIGNMNSSQRSAETAITEFAFNKLGIKPIYRIKGSGRLEGGDYMPAGDFTLIGCGLRTNEEGIRQLLENKVFGFNEVAVVKDPFKHQDQMHLDTYFNIIGHKTALVDEIRRNRGSLTREGLSLPRPIRPSVDIYLKENNGSYKLSRTGVDFFDYIEKEKGFELIDISDEEQLRYGCNFLCIGEKRLIGVKGVSDSYIKKLKDSNVAVEFVEFGNVTKTYGGPHCTTQVLYRS